MMKTSRFLTATALSGLMLAASAATAQTATDQGQPANSGRTETPNAPTEDQVGSRPGEQAHEQADNGEAGSQVIVTGTRLSRPGVTSNAPLTSITADELLSQSNVNIGDALN